MTSKQIPSSVEAERQVLGAVLTDARAMDIVAPILTPSDFYLPKHQVIFRAALELFAVKEAIDQTTVSAKVVAHASIISELVDGVRTPKNVESHARVVKQTAEKRGILDIASQLVDMAHDKELAEVRTFAKDVVTKVLTSDDERRSLLGPKEQVDILRRMIEERRQGIVAGLPSGFPRLDGLTGGLKRGDLIIVGARTSVGKSSFVENIAENVAESGYPVLYVSVEMDPSQMVYRFAKRWGLSPAILEFGSDDEDSTASLEKMIQRRLETPVHIWNAPGASTVGIRSHVNQLTSEIGGVDLVIIDYLQLMTDTFGGKLPEHLRLGMLTKTLKQMAREYEIPIILVTQLNRASDQRGVLPEPRLSDIRESGRIEEDADLILMLWTDTKPDALGNDTRLKIAKNRQGAKGEVPIRFHKPSFKFSEPSDNEVTQLLILKSEDSGKQEWDDDDG